MKSNSNITCRVLHLLARNFLVSNVSSRRYYYIVQLLSAEWMTVCCMLSECHASSSDSHDQPSDLAKLAKIPLNNSLIDRIQAAC